MESLKSETKVKWLGRGPVGQNVAFGSTKTAKIVDTRHVFCGQNAGLLKCIRRRSSARTPPALTALPQTPQSSIAFGGRIVAGSSDMHYAYELSKDITLLTPSSPPTISASSHSSLSDNKTAAIIPVGQISPHNARILIENAQKNV